MHDTKCTISVKTDKRVLEICPFFPYILISGDKAGLGGTLITISESSSLDLRLRQAEMLMRLADQNICGSAAT